MFTLDAELYPLIERILLMLVLLASEACLFLGARNILAFQDSFSQLLLLFWIWLLTFYLAAVLPLIVAGGMLDAWYSVGRPFYSGLLVLLHLVLVGVFLWNVPWRAGTVVDAPGIYGPVGSVAAVFVLLAGSVLVYYRHSDTNVVRAACFLAVAAFVAAALLGDSLPGAITPRVPVENKAGSTSKTPLLVIGLDGADWDYIDPLIDQGELPTFERLRQSGSWGRLETIEPTDSPVLWTSIATGMTPDQHGINGFVGYEIAGSDRLVAPPEVPPGTGLQFLIPYLVKNVVPLNSTHRRRFAYWEIASQYNQPVSVLNWWMTWPADDFFGQMITERIHFRGFGSPRVPTERQLTHPRDLRDWALSRMVLPGEVDYEYWDRFLNVTRREYRALREQTFEHHQLPGEFPFVIGMLESNITLANDLITRGRKQFDRPVDHLMLLRAIDLAGHMALKYSTLVDSPERVSEWGKKKFGGFVGNVYRRVDRALRGILRRYDNPNVIIVSDHGFERIVKNGEARFDHPDAPDGIWLASGPAFRKGHRGRLNLYQVLPLILRTKGLPVAKNLAGAVPTRVLEKPLSTRSVQSRPDSYGNRIPGRSRSGEAQTNRKIKNHLRGLGYL